MSEYKEEKKPWKVPTVALNVKVLVDGQEIRVNDEKNHFLAYVAGSQLRDAEIAAFDIPPNDDPYFEVVSRKSMTSVVRVSQASFDSIKRARPVIDIHKA